MNTYRIKMILIALLVIIMCSSCGSIQSDNTESIQVAIKTIDGWTGPVKISEARSGYIKNHRLIHLDNTIMIVWQELRESYWCVFDDQATCNEKQAFSLNDFRNVDFHSLIQVADQLVIIAEGRNSQLEQVLFALVFDGKQWQMSPTLKLDNFILNMQAVAHKSGNGFTVAWQEMLANTSLSPTKSVSAVMDSQNLLNWQDIQLHTQNAVTNSNTMLAATEEAVAILWVDKITDSDAGNQYKVMSSMLHYPVETNQWEVPLIVNSITKYPQSLNFISYNNLFSVYWLELGQDAYYQVRYSTLMENNESTKWSDANVALKMPEKKNYQSFKVYASEQQVFLHWNEVPDAEGNAKVFGARYFIDSGWSKAFTLVDKALSQTDIGVEIDNDKLSIAFQQLDPDDETNQRVPKIYVAEEL